MSVQLKLVWVAALIFCAGTVMNGVKTYRANRLQAFASGLQRKIGIETIHIKVQPDAIVLEGAGSAPQKHYAEKLAERYLAAWPYSSIKAPKAIKNYITDVERHPSSLTTGFARQPSSVGATNYARGPLPAKATNFARGPSSVTTTSFGGRASPIAKRPLVAKNSLVTAHR